MINNELLFSYKREIEKLKKEKPTKENLEMIGILSEIHESLIEIHRLDVQSRTIEEAQKKLLEDTAEYIQANFKATQEFEKAYVEVMKMYMRRINNESNQRI